MKSISRSFLQLVSSKILIQIVQIATIPIVLRYYEPDEYGKVAIYSALLGIFMIFINSTENTKIRFSREEYDNDGGFNKTFWGIIFIKLPIVLISFFLIVFFRTEILAYTDLPDSIIIVFFIASFFSLFTGSTQLLFSQEKFGLGAALSLIRIVIRLGFIALLVLNAIRPLAIALIITTLISTCLIDVLVIIILNKKIGRPRFNYEWIWMMLKFSVPFLFIIGGALTVDYIDSIVIRKYLSFNELGIYSVGYKLYSFVLVPFVMISTIITPKMISAFNNKDHDKIGRFYTLISNQVTLFITQIISFGVLFFPLLVYFVGNKYIESVPIIAILFISTAWLPASSMIEPFFLASKKIRTIILAYLLMAIVNILLDFILVPKIGIKGAAISTVCAYFTSFIVFSFSIKRFIYVNIYESILFVFPLVIVCIMVALRTNFYLIFCSYAIGSLLIWIVSYRRRLYNDYSLSFFKKMGLPGFLDPLFIKIYERMVIRKSNNRYK